MKKLILFVLTVVGLLTLTLPARAQFPVDYFNAGKFMEFTNNSKNLQDFSPDELKAKFASGRQLFVKVGATPAVLASYDSLVKTSLSLPLSRAYSGWTQAQQDTWNKSEMDAAALNQWLGTDLDTKPCFFFWLGNKTELLDKSLPLNYGSSSDLPTAQSLAQPGVQKFAQFASGGPTIFATLQLPVQNAVKAIASHNSNASNLSWSDITDIQRSASVIFTAAVNRKLTRKVATP
jgi:hypothetical protein